MRKERLVKQLGQHFFVQFGLVDLPSVSPLGILTGWIGLDPLGTIVIGVVNVHTTVDVVPP